MYFLFLQIKEVMIFQKRAKDIGLKIFQKKIDIILKTLVCQCIFIGDAI